MKEIIDFLADIEALKSVTRKIRPRGLDRHENPAEHSWQIALFAVALHAHGHAPDVDLARVVRMLLVHDLGEIDTGDTLAFVEDGRDERKTAERAAVERICKHVPALRDAWLEFEAEETPEARFAHAVDRAMPVLQNLANGGQSWRENGIDLDRVVRKVEPPVRGGCPALWTYLDEALRDARERGLLDAS